ncbi:MFS transporter [Catenulispora yoronensis]|uniref:MFS transporter n=1 Tax=Catenulispora yoronensis TaxID=450799 RepID=A0ABP5GUD9_9ACTN
MTAAAVRPPTSADDPAENTPPNNAPPNDTPPKNSPAENSPPKNSPPENTPPPSLWHNVDFLKFWLGETISLFGTQVTALALPLTAVTVFHASDGQVGLLRFLQLAPYLLLALLFGAVVDRMRRRRVLLLANGARMVLIGLIPLLSATHHLTLGLLLGLAAAIGVFSVLFDVSWMAFVPTVVRDSRSFVEANQKTGVTASAADVAGPGVAGAVIGALTAPTALAVDAASYLVSLVTLLWIRTPEARPPGPSETTARRSIAAEIRDGLRFVFGHRVLRPLALVGPFSNFALVSVWTMFLLYASRDRGLSPAQIGLVFSMSSLGGLLGATLSRRVIARFRFGLVYAVSMGAMFAGPVLIPLAGGPRAAQLAVFIAAFFISYLGLGIANIVVISIRQAATPAPMMGRMTAAFRTLLFGGGSLGGLVGGLLAGSLGAREALAVVGTGSLLMLVPLALSPVSRLRTQSEVSAGATAEA